MYDSPPFLGPYSSLCMHSQEGMAPSLRIKGTSTRSSRRDPLVPRVLPDRSQECLNATFNNGQSAMVIRSTRIGCIHYDRLEVACLGMSWLAGGQE
jgi:hypothetical protein